MTEFKTDISENGKKFELVFQTDNKAYFEKMQATARECIDHKPDGFCDYGERDGRIMKYRKKPVVVEAYKTNKEIVIHTLEGDMKASIGDYIITGVNGEQYPCKPDIFEKTYEAVTNTNYDRIKAMTIEEMAEFICGIFDVQPDDSKYINGDLIPMYDENEIRQWLQMEVS